MLLRMRIQCVVSEDGKWVDPGEEDSELVADFSNRLR